MVPDPPLARPPHYTAALDLPQDMVAAARVNETSRGRKGHRGGGVGNWRTRNRTIDVVTSDFDDGAWEGAVVPDPPLARLPHYTTALDLPHYTTAYNIYIATTACVYVYTYIYIY